MKLSQSVGIVSYGVDIPHYRIKITDIAAAWSKSGTEIERSLGLIEKTVPGADEDSLTLAVNASLQMAERAGSKLVETAGAVYVGSESHPYAVKPTAVTVAEALGIGNNFTAADLEFACKAGTAAMQIVSGMVAGGLIQSGLAIGADTAQSRPADALEFSAGAASAAYLIGKTNVIAKLLYTLSFSSDTPDFWRRGHALYPSHGGRFTGEPAYFRHVISAVKLILEESRRKISDFDHVVLHMPNARFPKTAAKMLGVTDKQLEAGFMVPMLGNSYSACSLVGLAAVLDVAKPGELILVCSYGSGSGSDAFIYKVTDKIKQLPRKNPVREKIAAKEYVNYSTYIKNMKKLKL